MQVMEILEALAGLVLAMCAVLGWHAMTVRTRHCFRVAYGLIGVCGAGHALAPFFAGDPVLELTGIPLAMMMRVGLIVGFALLMVLDRRRIRPQRDPAPAPVEADPDDTLRPGARISYSVGQDKFNIGPRRLT